MGRQTLVQGAVGKAVRGIRVRGRHMSLRTISRISSGSIISLRWSANCLILLGALGSLLLLGFAAARAQDPPSPQAPEAAKALTSEQLSEMMTQQMQQSMAASELRQQKMNDKLAQAFIAMEGLSSQDLEAAWKIDVDFHEQPARTVLERLLAELGLRLGNADEHEAALDKSVSLQQRGVSRLQAIELICSQIGLYPDYARQPDLQDGGPFAAMALMMGAMAGGKMPVQSPPSESSEESPPAVVLRKGVRPIPLAFAGPFAVEVTRLSEYPPDATGRLDISLFAGGIPDSVQAYWSDGMWRMWARPIGLMFFKKWNELNGLDVVDSGEALMASQSSAVLPGRTTQIALRNLLRSVTSIRLGTEISVPFPTKIETIRFDDLTVTPVTLGTEFPVTVTKVDIRPAEQAPGIRQAHKGGGSIRVEANGKFGTRVSCVVLDAEGHVLNGMGSSYTFDMVSTRGNGASPDTEIGRFSGRLEVQGVPKTLVVKVLMEEQTLKFPAELNVALKSSQEQVEQLAELEFDGPCPVELESQGVRKESLFWKVDVQVKNHSNKNLWHVNAKMQYLDREGKKLKEETALLHALPEPGDARFLLTKPRSTRKIETTAFFAPDELASVRFVLESVTFGDGTTWKPPQP